MKNADNDVFPVDLNTKAGYVTIPKKPRFKKMMISTKGRYALRVIIDLAENGGDDYIPMKQVAERQEISLKYLERILPLLVSEGLIEGVHGKGGGYKLTRKPEDITVGEILRATEGGLAPVACLECSTEECNKKDTCKTRPMWVKLDNMINSYLDSVTIKNLMEGD